MALSPIKVAVTGAAGQIGYNLIFRIASGAMLGENQPVILNLLDLEPSQGILSGVKMELDDCAFPLLREINITHDPYVAFSDVDIALLVGAKPRSKGMERKDLLTANGQIFVAQGKALNEVAKSDVKVVVVGNPANTNALIAMHNAPRLCAKNFTALMRLDHNRATSQLLMHLKKPMSSHVHGLTVWGNHSATQYPDIFHTEIDGTPVSDLIQNGTLTQDWIESYFIPTIQQRGAKVIEARGQSSAASAANAVINHTRDWLLGNNTQTSMAVINTKSYYNLPTDIICGLPLQCTNGSYTITENLELNEFSRSRIIASCNELVAERDAIKDLFGTH